MKNILIILLLALSVSMANTMGTDESSTGIEQEVWITNNPVPAEENELEIFFPDKKGIWEVTLFDALGNMMEQTHCFDGGICTLSLKNRNGQRIASGSYLAVITFRGRDGSREVIRKGIGVQR